MAKMTRTLINGNSITFDPDNITWPDNRGTLPNCFDLIALIPVSRETKQYESKDAPGYIAALKALGPNKGLFHPRDPKGYPIESVIIDAQGGIVSKK